MDKGGPPLDAPAKARLRNQALIWLKAECDEWSGFLRMDPSRDRFRPQMRLSAWNFLPHVAFFTNIAGAMGSWKVDTDLASGRRR
jgi:hypothetical protein